MWRLIDSLGYARLYPEQPNPKNWLNFKYEHRQVMQDKLQRDLALQEIIHHLDQNKSNNALENLKLVADHVTHMREEHPEFFAAKKQPMLRPDDTAVNPDAADTVRKTAAKSVADYLDEARKARDELSHPGVSALSADLGTDMKSDIATSPTGVRGGGLLKAAGEYASTQVEPDLSHPVAKTVLQLRGAIPKHHMSDSEKDYDRPHVTLRYGLHDDDPTNAAEVIKQHGRPVVYRTGKVSVFENPKADVLKIEINSPDMQELNDKLLAVKNTETHKGYTPHMTIAYLKPGLGKHYAAVLANALEGHEFTTNQVTFSDKQRRKVSLPTNSTDDGDVKTGALETRKYLRNKRESDTNALKNDPDNVSTIGELPGYGYTQGQADAGTSKHAYAWPWLTQKVMAAPAAVASHPMVGAAKMLAKPALIMPAALAGTSAYGQYSGDWEPMNKLDQFAAGIYPKVVGGVDAAGRFVGQAAKDMSFANAGNVARETYGDYSRIADELPETLKHIGHRDYAGMASRAYDKLKSSVGDFFVRNADRMPAHTPGTDFIGG